MSGIIFNIERFAIHDGPGIRTLVFLKGCPLRCLWCSNPDGQNAEPEILFDTDLCNRCGECVDVCPLGIIEKTHGAGKLLIDRAQCSGCGDCVIACAQSGTGALQLIGRHVSVQEVLYEIEKDRVFYENSGGGVTLSGGEPLFQAEFASKILKECKRAGLHTALETSGYAPFGLFKSVLESVDLVLYDIKHMDSELHRKFTGAPNKLVLRNALRLSNLRVRTIARIPIVPGCNDSRSNLERAASFVSELNVEEINLLPYHFFGSSKCRKLGRNYELDRVKPPSREKMLEIKRLFESTVSSKVRIGG